MSQIFGIKTAPLITAQKSSQTWGVLRTLKKNLPEARASLAKEEELFENHVMGFNANVFEQKSNEDDYNQPIEIRTDTDKIVISYK